MIVYFARDGVEIGAYQEEDLRRYAHSGELRPTDHYWYEGMPDWLPLAQLLGPDAWQPVAERWPRRPLRSVLIVTGAGSACAVIALLVGYKLSTSGLSLRPAVQSSSSLLTDTLLRKRAADELIAKLNKLPTTPSSSSNLFYYALKVMFPEPPDALTATVTGAEDVIDPTTRTTLWHTPFILALIYRNAEWTYSDYRASTTNMKDGTVMEIDGSRNGAIQPTIVSLLNLKETSGRIRHE